MDKMQSSQFKISGLLQLTFLCSKTTQPLAYSRSEQTKPFGDHQDFPPTRGMGYLNRLQGRLLPYTFTGTIQEIFEISHPRSGLPVQGPANRFAHSTHGVHCDTKGGETDGYTQGFKNPPVPRLVGESQKLLPLPACPVREFMPLIGLITATEKQVHLGRLHITPIQWHHWKVPESLEKVIPIPRSLHPHLQWWLKEDNVHTGQPLHPIKRALQIFTDASIEATDNTTVVSYINKEGGMKSGPLCALLCRILTCCTRKQVTLKPDIFQAG